MILMRLTCSVDIDTDKIMQEVIRTAFRDATIIAIAHRLDTILDFDSVVVIDKGEVMEQGSPRSLLNTESAFKAIYETYRNKRRTEENGSETSY